MARYIADNCTIACSLNYILILSMIENPRACKLPIVAFKSLASVCMLPNREHSFRAILVDLARPIPLQ